VATVPTGTTTGSVVVTVGGVASNGVGFTVGDPDAQHYKPQSRARACGDVRDHHGDQLRNHSKNQHRHIRLSLLALFTLCTKSVSQLLCTQAIPHSF
jgi:hypothetical protein